MIKTDVLILGGGLAGLSTAHHLDLLGASSALVVEKKGVPGGLAGTIEKDGFLFDHTGHLLHLHDPYGQKLILDLLGGNVATHERSSWVYSKKAFTRYPFQANTFGLPRPVVEDCVTGFLKAVHRPGAPLSDTPSFEAWCLKQFGAGISRHFMFPYNRKLWRLPLSRLTTEWQGRFVPRPAAAEVLYGAVTDQKKFFGYNASFRYPVRGGIRVLPDALAARLKPGVLRTGCAVERVDLREKVAVVGGLGEVRYERLVNTLPLPFFLDLCAPLPADVKAARRKLRHNAVYNLNLGVEGAETEGRHWIYFPEERFPFYRAGYMSNFAKSAAPAGTRSLYIEAARGPGEKADLPRLENAMLAGLRSCGLLKPAQKLLTKLWIEIPCAYVVYDFQRTPSVKKIFGHLETRGVESIGRYGGWKYSFMEETILDGKRCAERLLGRGGAEAEPSQAELRPLK